MPVHEFSRSEWFSNHSRDSLAKHVRLQAMISLPRGLSLDHSGRHVSFRWLGAISFREATPARRLTVEAIDTIARTKSGDGGQRCAPCSRACPSITLFSRAWQLPTHMSCNVRCLRVNFEFIERSHSY